MASSSHDVSWSHTTTRHGRTPLGRVISSSQRPLPDNTQHIQQRNIRASGGIRTPDRSRRAAVDLRLRPRGHWDRQNIPNSLVNFNKNALLISQNVWHTLNIKHFLCTICCVRLRHIIYNINISYWPPPPFPTTWNTNFLHETPLSVEVLFDVQERTDWKTSEKKILNS
jgi:hypothetical protein